MSKPLLTDADFCRASKRLKCDVAAIKAVANTESAGKGFYDDGFPVILYERHLFQRFTQGKWSKDYPELSGRQGNYGATGQNQRRKFSAAFALSADAAMKACSWGKFQILGSNHKVCGYNTVGEFVDAMKHSEGKQLDAFVSFVIGNNLDGHLRNHDWAKFARGYNGPGYKKNNYDTKMATAFAKFKKENIDCSKVSAADSKPAKKIEVPPATDEPVDTTDKQPPTDSGSTRVETPAEAMPEPIAPPKVTQQTSDVQVSEDGTTAVSASTKVGGFKWLMTAIIAIVTGQAAVPEFVSNGIQSPSVWTVILNIFQNLWTFKVYIVGAILLIFIIRKLEVTALKVAAMKHNANPNSGNVVLTKPVTGGWFTTMREKLGI